MRAMAVAAGLLVFAIVEAACVLLNLAPVSFDDDPYVGFTKLQPLFELDESGTHYTTAPSRLKFFARDSFAANKPAATKRIFCLGGSTVQGRPFSKETSFTTWLRLALEQADAQHQWEVVNCGGISYASYRLAPILEECLQYEPDAIILCTGHNEFLEDRSYRTLRETPAVIRQSFRLLSQLRSFRLFRIAIVQTIESSDGPAESLGPDVDAFLDYRDGIAAYHRDDVWRRGVIEHFDFNVNRMLQTARSHSMPILLVLPPSNLADSPPFKSEHRAGLSVDEQRRWDELVREARDDLTRFPPEAVHSFTRMLEIDDQFAATRFEFGRLLESLGDFDAARREFVAARDHDICPLRITTPMEQALRLAARRHHVPLLDAQALLQAQTKHGITDNSQLVDHVHPSFDGHQRIALAMVERLRDLNLVQPEIGWKDRAAQAFQNHFDQLPDVYFAKGEQNLANLRFWTKGMADGPAVETRFPDRLKRDRNRGTER